MIETEKVLDREAVLHMTAHDHTLLESLSVLFEGCYPHLLDDSRDAISSGDPVRLLATARRLKDIVRRLHAREALHKAEQMEAAANEGRLEEAPLLHRSLAERVLTLAATLRAMTAELATSDTRRITA